MGSLSTVSESCIDDDDCTPTKRACCYNINLNSITVDNCSDDSERLDIFDVETF